MEMSKKQTETTKRNFKGIWIPASVWMSKNFTSQEKIMLAEIDSLDNKDGCFASNAYFAEFFGLSERRVREIISELTKKGAVTTSQPGKMRVIKVAPSFQSGDIPPEGWQVSAKKDGGKVPPYNKEDNKDYISSVANAPAEGEELLQSKQNRDDCPAHEGPTPRKLVEANFEEWWKLYPRKVGKGAARKSFIKASKLTDHTTLMQSVRDHLNSEQWTKDGGQFIPYPATWLNQERWEDVIQKPKKYTEAMYDGLDL
jgi:hypothetical protein